MGPGGPLCRTQVNANFRTVRPHHRADICITREKLPAIFSHMGHNIQQAFMEFLVSPALIRNYKAVISISFI